MSRPAISVEHLSKKYFVGHQRERAGRYVQLREELMRHVRNAGRKAVDLARGRQIVQGDEVEEFWALKDVSFEVNEGEVLGIIGRNGAGKSTLLKILSRITEPSEGRITIRGRVASLLEVGTGFHQELSGRENIFLNGTILGMSRAEIRKKFDEIVAFAEVEKFLDTPVKRYSSGMYVRLAFAVAAHLEPEILIVDEVLSVGDAEFQKKCLGKMEQVSRREGRTVLFVSHHMAAVQSLCTRAVVLDGGTMRFVGTAEEAIAEYTAGSTLAASSWTRPRGQRSDGAKFIRLSASLDGGRPPELCCEAEISIEADRPPLLLAIDIANSHGAVIMQSLPSALPFLPGEAGEYTVAIDTTLPPLIPGTYSLSFWLGPHNTITDDFVENALAFDIVESPTPGRSYPHSMDHGSIVPPSRHRLLRGERILQGAA